MVKSLLLSAALFSASVLPTEAHSYYTCFQWDVVEPCVLMPGQMAQEAPQVIWCESKWDRYAIGWNGERGLLQIHPIHAESMREMGLSFYEERDRLAYAVEMWEYSGWRQWSCKP